MQHQMHIFSLKTLRVVERVVRVVFVEHIVMDYMLALPKGLGTRRFGFCLATSGNSLGGLLVSYALHGPTQ